MGNLQNYVKCDILLVTAEYLSGKQFNSVCIRRKGLSMIKKGNSVLIIHGGGLVDPSKEVIRRIARGLYEKKVYDRVILGHYSFMSLYTPSLWENFDEELDRKLEDVRGTYFGTCRGIDMTKPDMLEVAIKTLTEAGIGTIIVCGGDGSSRNCAEIYSEFERNDINIIFAVPLTVDGINGGMAIGLEQASREAVRQIENVAATSLETRDNGAFSVVAVELQGRNRDDILVDVLWHFHSHRWVADCKLSEICLLVVPANYPTDEAKLYEQINNTDKRTLVLVSEGAKIKLSELQKNTHRKVRTVIVGHAVQSNGQTTKYDMQNYESWLSDIVRFIDEEPNKSYSIVNDGYERRKEPLEYYAVLNPRENQKAQLSDVAEYVLKMYMANSKENMA